MQHGRYRYWTMDQAYQRTLKRYPRRWYEQRTTLVLVGMGWGWLLAAGQLYAFGIETRWGGSIFGGLCYIAGLVMDIYSTERVMRLKPAFDRRRLDFPLAEQNPTLPLHPTLKSHLGFRSLLCDGLLLLLVVLYLPVVGVGSLTYRLGAATNNHRQEQRLLLLLRMYDRGQRRATSSHQTKRPFAKVKAGD